MIQDPNIHRLTYDDKEIVLIGTAHVSKESADLVTGVIESERPDTVCIELCPSRYQALTQKKRWEETDLLKAIREKKAFLLLANLMLASFQKRIGDRLGIRPGQEILQAIAAAEEVGAKIHLADRDIRLTLSRTWRLMGLWKKSKLMAQLLVSLGDTDALRPEDIERMKQQDVLESLLSEMGEMLPEVRRVVIDERDQYLTHKIRTAPGKRIVAAVGAGHVPGILRYWHEPIDIHPLEQTPPKGRLSKVLKWALPASILALIILGFFVAGSSAGKDMITSWVIATGVLAGLGAGAALAHPLTILVAIAAAPLTTLHPMIAAGWVAGLSELFLGKPKVKDFERLSQDIGSVKGFWKNRISRILLVVVFTNIGASVGTFVAIPLMMKALS